MDWKLDSWMSIGEGRAVVRKGRHAARRAGRATDPEEERALRVEAAVDRLQLVNVALWELLRDKVGLEEEALRAKIQEVDLRDGSADAKLGQGSGTLTCPSCSGPNRDDRRTCLYCGAKLPVDPMRFLQPDE